MENGLHIILHQDNTNPLVSVSVLYHVGTKNESPGKSGFAHFFEHLMFEGSKNIKRGEFFKYIASNGGKNNAYTNHDETCYYEVLPSDRLPLALWLESERMFNAKIDEESIHIQRKVVKEEKKMQIENQPYAKAISEIIPSFLFQKHPYKYPIIGLYKDLDTATEKDYNKFYDTYYVPNNAILVVAGDFEINEAIEWIHRYFYSIPKGKIDFHMKKIEEKPIKEEVFSTYMDKNTKVPGVFLSYRIPKIIDQDSYVLKIIDHVLSSGESSRITKNVINKKQLASYAGSFLDIMEDYGIFIIYGLINPGVTLDEVTKVIDEEIENLKDKGVNQYELDKQKNYFEKKILFDNYSMSGIAGNLAHYSLYYKNTDLINTDIEKYRKISVEDIKIVANKYLNVNCRVRLYNVPSNY
ncbi:MAG: insulinase family protein [Flavobacteriales bacterium]|uniref:M16 family metallopeptidase n=1 Tax=Blattabacterium sp. (Mastotermes darwiniensis) TaxID=39768 RepID=UPI001EE51FB4|nr:pitrilysin family protein [Blattabacterium sp. (Mastotermes darwiniensis)]MDR1804902.1 insulinase family protein [Flavobacteriales bacterium]